MSLTGLIRKRFGAAQSSIEDVAENKTLVDILSRASCRRFAAEGVDDALMQTLFATAFSAPSKSDLQQACVVRLTDRRKIECLADATPSIDWIRQSPEFMVWCGDGRRIRKLSEHRGYQFANDHLDAFMNAAVDAGIAMQTFIVAAESVGLGVCPVSEVRNDIDLLSDVLGLPDLVFPVAGLCVGWPFERPNISMRLPTSVTVMENQYDDSQLLDLVQTYDRVRETIDQTPSENQRLKDVYGVSDTYGWSENRTRQYSIPARTDFGRYVRGQGFSLV